jgi:uncharacterized membrane protein YhhN
VYFALAGVAAVIDWFAVERRLRVVEYIAKPATTVFLLHIALTAATDQPTMRGYVVAALVFCLAGDVFLMLPRDAFVPGLASFLIAHVLFVLAFVNHEPFRNLVPTTLVGLVAMPFLIAPVLAAVERHHAQLRVPVLLYAAAISAMFFVSGATWSAFAVGGAATFVVSDTILARNRFVRPIRHGQVATMVTYHAALALIVLSLR